MVDEVLVYTETAPDGVSVAVNDRTHSLTFTVDSPSHFQRLTWQRDTGVVTLDEKSPNGPMEHRGGIANREMADRMRLAYERYKADDFSSSDAAHAETLVASAHATLPLLRPGEKNAR